MTFGSILAYLFVAALLPFIGQGIAEGQESSAARAGGFRLEAEASYGFGSTIYELNALSPDPRGGGGNVPIRSRLEFPLDAVYAGGRLSWRPGEGALERWGFSLSGLTNLNDPSSKMINSDYVDGSEVIHTESDAQLDYIAGSGEVSYILSGGENTTVNLLFRTDYRRIEELMVGYAGWQASLFTGTKYDISGTGPVLEYRVTYVSPQLGAEVRQRLGKNAGVGLKGSAGMVFANDFDNHILRGRTSEGSGTGVGLGSTAVVELLPGSLPIEDLFLTVSGGFTYYYAEGGMDQTFSSGEQYLDIPYTFENLLFTVGMTIGFEF